MASVRVSRPGENAREDDVARVRTRPSREHTGRRLLHRRRDLAATALRPVLHRTGHPACAPGRGHAESERAVVAQQARPTSWSLAERPAPLRFLIRDRDQKFTDAFDDVFRSEAIDVVRTPCRTPQANGIAERFVGTVRSECFDRLLILNQQHLERVLQGFIDHYNGHRAHRALSLTPPAASLGTATPSAPGNARIVRRDRGFDRRLIEIEAPVERAENLRARPALFVFTTHSRRIFPGSRGHGIGTRTADRVVSVTRP